jgi:hypothetical protein
LGALLETDLGDCLSEESILKIRPVSGVDPGSIWVREAYIWVTSGVDPGKATVNTLTIPL